MKRAVLLLLALGAAAAQAQPVPATVGVPERIASERQRLQTERDAVEQAHEGLKRECWQRFAVNDCLREVRRKRHAALDPLRAQELELNVQERAWRTQQRDERLREKESSSERKP